MNSNRQSERKSSESVRYFLALNFLVKFATMSDKMDKLMGNSQPITQLVSYWKRNGLSTRASYVLAKAGISETQLASYRDFEALVCIKNCGTQTAQEIWDIMTNPEREMKEVKFEDLIPK